MVTSFNPLEAFIYDEGFVRLSTVKYSTAPEDIDNLFIHLTNSSIQCKNTEALPDSQARSTWDANDRDHPMSKASEDEKGGTKLSLAYLWRRLRETLSEDAIVALKQSINEVIVKSLVCVEDAIPNQINSFELFGYDILIDRQLKPWLIEVNSSPSMGIDNDLDRRIKGTLIDDTLRLIDPLPCDRVALMRVLERRVEELRVNRLRPYNSTTVVGSAAHRHQLNRDLTDILRGRKPRVHGELPRHMGGFKRLAPGSSAFHAANKLKRECRASQRRPGAAVRTLHNS